MGGSASEAGSEEELPDRGHSPRPQEVQLTRLKSQSQPLSQHTEQEVQLQLVHEFKAPLGGRLRSGWHRRNFIVCLADFHDIKNDWGANLDFELVEDNL